MSRGVCLFSLCATWNSFIVRLAGLRTTARKEWVSQGPAICDSPKCARICIMLGERPLQGNDNDMLLLYKQSCEINEIYFCSPYILTRYNSLTKFRHFIRIEKEHDVIPHWRHILSLGKRDNIYVIIERNNVINFVELTILTIEF